jgi:hypothetical protein
MPESRLPIELCELVIDSLDDVHNFTHSARAAWLAEHFFLPAAVISSTMSISLIEIPPNVSSISFAWFHLQPVLADISVNSG